MNRSDFPLWMLESLSDYQLDVNDRWEARDRLRRHYEDKYRGSSQKKQLKRETELRRVDWMEDYLLSAEFIRAFRPHLDVADDLWRRCDRVHGRYLIVRERSVDDMHLLLRLVKYINVFEQLEPGRDYAALWADIKDEWSPKE